MPVIVSLDLETTGLDPTLDSIIEIGAVKFNDSRIDSEFTTLINPRKPIPAFITNLTGISNSMVQHAPFLQQALPELVDFIGNAPILGQNIGFDLAFLQKNGAFRNNPALDTYELAAVLMPTASRYNLGSLARQLGVLQPATHRALDDAKATHAVYLKLLAKIEELPLDLVAEILRLSEGLDWKGELPFRWSLQKMLHQGIKPKQGVIEAAGNLLYELSKPEKTKPLVPREITTPLDVDQLAEKLQPGGEFAQCFRALNTAPNKCKCYVR